ncbi:MAG: nitroreductase family protein [Actinomycetota bacterium]
MTSFEFDLGTVDRLLSTTRTVRKRLDLSRPVPDEVIEECLRLAIQAPTGSNMQTWRFVIVTDEGKRQIVADAYRKAIGPYLKAMARFARIRTPSGQRVYESAEYLGEVIDQVPVLVIPCVLGRVEGARPFFEAMGVDESSALNVTASGLYGSIWPAVWSFMLALRSRGVGSALTTMHLAYEREVGEALKIPDTVTQVGLLPVAYYTGETFRPAKRRPAEQVTYWNEWKQRKARPRSAQPEA